MTKHLFEHADDCVCGVCTWDAYPPEVQDLARMLSESRVGPSSVFMDGRHNPTPTEVRNAKRFYEYQIAEPRDKQSSIISAQQKALEKLLEVGCWVYDFNNYDSKETDTCFYCAASHPTSVDERDRTHNPNCAYVIAKDLIDNPFNRGAQDFIAPDYGISWATKGDNR